MPEIHQHIPVLGNMINDGQAAIIYYESLSLFTIYVNHESLSNNDMEFRDETICQGSHFHIDNC